MDENLTATPHAEEPKMNFFNKLIGIFTNPSSVFQNLAVYPDWLWPMIVMVVLAIGSGFLVKDIAIDAQMDRIGKSERIPDEPIWPFRWSTPTTRKCRPPIWTTWPITDASGKSRRAASAPSTQTAWARASSTLLRKRPRLGWWFITRA